MTFDYETIAENIQNFAHSDGNNVDPAEVDERSDQEEATAAPAHDHRDSAIRAALANNVPVKEIMRISSMSLCRIDQIRYWGTLSQEANA